MTPGLVGGFTKFSLSTNKLARYAKRPYVRRMLNLLVNIPSLLMAETAECVRCIFAGICLAGLSGIALGMLGLYLTDGQRRADRATARRALRTM